MSAQLLGGEIAAPSSLPPAPPGLNEPELENLSAKTWTELSPVTMPPFWAAAVAAAAAAAAAGC